MSLIELENTAKKNLVIADESFSNRNPRRITVQNGKQQFILHNQ
jgi:hypothetical protein